MSALKRKPAAGGLTSAGIYVHVPFCRTPKCAYCDFYSEACDRTLVRRFTTALADEFTAALEDPYWRSVKVGSVFFGGGTPSLLEAVIVAEWIGHFRRGLVFAADAEITLECNPEDLSPAKAGELLALGVNRLSVGCQSFAPAVLEALGRCHSSSSARRALEVAAGAGFSRLSADLIIASPGSSAATTLFSIEAALELKVEHL
ncbi:MAG TPA: radical SAM protein, partial [Candidatus Glassbacteria bacterium]|nr:radical SAM protein [Candidatus Glassbacteria bacterium]